MLFASGPLTRRGRRAGRRRPHHPARGERRGGAHDRVGRSVRGQQAPHLRGARVDGDGRLARREGELLRSVARVRVRQQRTRPGSEDANDRLHRRRQDRPADLGEPDQERLSACSAIAAARSPISRSSAACRRSRRPTSARRPTSCSPACRSTEAMDEVVNGPQGPDPFRTARPDHRRARLASGAGQAEACRAARGKGRDLSRRRGERHARHGGGAQGRDLSRRRRRGREEGRAGDQGLRRSVPLFRAVRRRDQGQAGQQPPGRDQHRRRPPRRWRSGSRPASTST